VLQQVYKGWHYSDFRDADKFSEFYWLFSREAHADGSYQRRIDELAKPKGGAKQRGLFKGGYQPVDESFLLELADYRETLAKYFKKADISLDSAELTEFVQRTLDRLVFMRFLEDKQIETEVRVSNLGKSKNAWADFQIASRRLDNIYNGIVFKPLPKLDDASFEVDDDMFGDICERLDVLYEELNGCEATLVGFGSKAIATVRPSSSRGRERFSVAHEIGHWLIHRGKSFRCRADDLVQNYSANIRFEKEADEFASHLLMPTSIFRPAIKATNKPSLNDLQGIAEQFEVSMQAVSIRLATLDTLPIIVACYTKAGLKWSIRASHVPKRWWLRSQLDDDSFAYDVLHKGTPCNNLGKQPAETWFENDDADEYEVLEHSMPSTNGQVLVLLYLNDPEMFEVGFDQNLKYGRSNNARSR